MPSERSRIRCLVVDDEPLAAGILKKYIGQLDDLLLLGTCSNALEALALLQRQPADLLFLDIQMPRLTGVDLLKTWAQRPPVILTTAYRDYAIEGFELQVLDYLVKPFSFERFLAAVNRYYSLHRQDSRSPSGTTIVKSEAEQPFLYLKADKKMVKVFLKDILYIESLKDYVKVRTIHRDILTYQRITYLEEKLPDERFLRIHRSYIVALDKITAFSMTSIEIGNTELPIGRLYKNEVMKVLGV